MKRILQLVIPVAIMIAALIWLAPAAGARTPAPPWPAPTKFKPLALPARRALEIAPVFWGRKPPCHPIVAGLLRPGELSDFAPAGIAATFRPCAFFMDGGTTIMSSAEQCEVVLHEYGHLLGLEHSTDPKSIMYATGRASPPAICRSEARKQRRHCARMARSRRWDCRLRWGVLY